MLKELNLKGAVWRIMLVHALTALFADSQRRAELALVSTESEEGDISGFSQQMNLSRKRGIFDPDSLALAAVQAPFRSESVQSNAEGNRKGCFRERSNREVGPR